MGRRLAIFAVTILILIGRGNVADAAPSVHLSFLPPQPVKVTEAAAAAASPLPVGELADHRTRFSRTSRHANGSLTTTISAAPINYRDAKGHWQPIDSRLIASSTSGYAWRNAANSFAELFKEKLGPDFLRFDVDGKSFQFTLQGAAAQAASVKGSRISYGNVFSGVSLQYDLGSTGAEETLRLADANVPTHYRFTLTPPSKTAVDVRKGPDGSWLVVMAPSHRPVFVLAAPLVQDSPRDPKAVPAPERRASLSVSRQGSSFSIDLTVDSAWLHDSRRHFPVLVDPTLTVQPDTQDADFTWNQPTYSPWLGASIPMGTDSTNTWRPGVQFDLSSIPAGASVTGASLGLYYNGYCLATANPGCPNTSHTVDVHRMTAAWNTSSTTSQIQFDSTILSSFTLPAGAPNEWMTWDVSTAVKNWLSGTWSNYGLFLNRDPDNTLNLSGPYPPGMRYTADTTVLPELNVTYNTDGVTLNQPSTLHSNGADLSWTRYTGSLSGAPFQKYEVHRSTVKNFTPSSSTLLTTIDDISVTSYRDTTAAPSATFYYEVVANSSGSNQVAVTLPADGTATKTLQPAAGKSQDTYISWYSTLTNCANYGANNDMSVGTDSVNGSNSISRALVSYNLSDIPANATITRSTLSLFRGFSVPHAATVHAYRVTRAWGEGTGVSNPAACTGNGATWYEANAGVNWTNQGGDFATGTNDVSPAVSLTAGQSSGWDAYDITSIAQQWVNASAPNLGVLLKYDSEAIQAGNEVDYWSNDYTGTPTLMPKLTVTYQDGSHAIAPTVNVSAPAPSATVMGSSVNLTATATDDRYVAKVEFSIDGVLVGSSTSGSPFGITWNST
ncbi:MAG TPA: DNRLRE domain-containing protein, partial [Amycolatopsis sp.]|nr:DNRLRE domain-containing protein [Amycolatopsis sp.]